MPNTVQHPSTRDIADHRATLDRLESHTKPRVLCSYCAWEIAPGQEPVSHGLCDDPPCHQIASEATTVDTVIQMHRIASRANAAYVTAKRFRNPAVEKDAWDAAEHRFRTALRLLVEDMERGK